MGPRSTDYALAGSYEAPLDSRGHNSRPRILFLHNRCRRGLDIGGHILYLK
jgi:hypothetical protein